MYGFISDLTQSISLESLENLYEEMVGVGYNDRMIQWILSGFRMEGTDLIYTLNPSFLFEIEFDIVQDELILPSTLFSIINLKKMELISMQGYPRIPVFSLPDNFNMPNLVELKISLLFISKVPSSIFNRPSLKILDLSDNNLSDIQILTPLNTKIEELYINSNEIKNLYYAFFS